MTERRVVITGMGIVSALGWTLEETWFALRDERSGLRQLSLFRLDDRPALLVGEVKEDPAARSGLRLGSRTEHLAVCAARQAFEHAGLSSLPLEARRSIGVALGVCTGGMLDSEEYVAQTLCEIDPGLELLRRHECSCATNAIAEALSLGGPCSTVSVACTSGAAAISVARDMIASGEADMMLAGGADSLTRLTVCGFLSLLVVAPDGCKPFDARRAGMCLGEGAGILALESEAHAQARGARALARLCGAANTCDAHHCTAPAPGGAGIVRAMQTALAEAGLSPEDVDYVNAHGTGTIDNDIAEGKALTEVFSPRFPWISSTKRFFGHTLAAAGAIEAIVAILALRRQYVPANLGLEVADPSLPFTPCLHTTPAALRVVMSNSLGFGGSNASLVFSRVAGEEKAS
ncbi:MAG TPA: beta-ketoacyl-[acyl-carrier-protein] synthase family protein [Candidatus Hydrogenedentes bacterium]|nr:beta-ketoacyl-[acyl-carrier-protein] synthase family protein [Candidatus Hydrogenedentota bacterium]